MAKLYPTWGTARVFEQLIDKSKNGTYITLETTPAHASRFSPLIDRIEELGLHELVDGFSTTDNPLAKLKYNALFAARLLQERFGKPVLATMSMRDRNRIALQSDLLGANEADVRAILALTGDPAKISDQPHTKGVFEGESTLLLEMISCFNSGIDYAGRPLGDQPEPIYPFSVVNSFAKNPRTLQKKMAKKIAAGTRGIITQPVYDLENAKLLLELLETAKGDCKGLGCDAQLILGLFPITRLRTAQFLSAHVPGIHVPPHWIETLRRAHDQGEEEEFKVGFELSKTLFETLKNHHPKLHLMTANKFDLAKALLS
jgi:5,10-methylenetetrahydrofolate reductase